MLIKGIVLLPVLLIVVASSIIPAPTGVQNAQHNCYLSSLLACLYDVPSFRKVRLKLAF